MTPEVENLGHHVPVRQTVTTWDPDRFVEACRSRGLTLQQLAITAGVSYSALLSYRSGAAKPSPSRLVAIAEALAVPSTDLAPLRPNPTLHELRWHSGLTVAQLAAAAGYSVSHTRLVLAGVNPITAPAAWAKALQVKNDSDLMRAWEAARAEQVEGGS